jgi:cytochrome oxidase Cu insertion factor (SCO1/SenC/PrrC family)
MMSGPRWGLIIGLLLGLAAATPPATAAGPDWVSFKAVPYEPPKPAPEFSLPDLDGRPVALADFRGKVALVFFWATW